MEGNLTFPAPRHRTVRMKKWVDQESRAEGKAWGQGGKQVWEQVSVGSSWEKWRGLVPGIKVRILNSAGCQRDRQGKVTRPLYTRDVTAP